ncbi:MAG TPA: hypothetical protein VK473_00375 [Terriglobales bacterium]|nr:hypothetical protein [Terriglobales bacterium]
MGYIAMTGALGLMGIVPLLVNAHALKNDRTRNAMRDSATTVTGLDPQDSGR